MGAGKEPITEDTPLTPFEERFVAEYVKCGSASEAARRLAEKDLTTSAATTRGSKLLHRKNIQARLVRLMNELEQQTIADASEVMSYFTKVMRGEIKDQFGLDASLSERTRAAQELAKRTVDIENKNAGNSDISVSIKLDWSRDNEKGE